eukprot:Phypoly_transcript_01217.p1 GENE.Phypoly_transcript_01217~~Phypoly_transcript_01217.p1  ORF type:complete len:983 (+),score=215.21 Phypoly_transcript_01217:557-3505(+)
MSKWGVPQFGSFNVDLGKAWKTVEKNIDKAIGIPETQGLQGHENQQHPEKENDGTISGGGRSKDEDMISPASGSPSIVRAQTLSTSNPGTPISSTSSTPTTPRTPKVPVAGKQNESISLEELLNSPAPITTLTKEGPKITPKHTKEAAPSTQNANSINYKEAREPKELEELEVQTQDEILDQQEAEEDEGENNHIAGVTHLSSMANEASQPQDQVDYVTQPSDDNSTSNPDKENDPSGQPAAASMSDPSKTLPTTEDDDAGPLSSLPDLPQHENVPQEQDESTLTRSSSSSSLMESETFSSSELELKSRIIELNGKMAAIAIIEKEKDRQLEEKTRLLAVREKQLESSMERQAALSSQVQNLTEEVEKLRTKASPSVSSSSSSTNDLVESLKEEFSRRLGNTEKKLQAVTKERDDLKRGQSMGDQAKGVVKAKDDEINTLRAEGTNLSLKILNLESALKKYRAAKKEDDATMASLREKLAQAEALLEKRNDRVKQLEFSEKKYLETITTMKDVSDNVTRKLEKKDAELSQALKQIQELQTNLDKATKELLGARKNHEEQGGRYLEEVEDAKRSVAQSYQILADKQMAEYQAQLIQREATIAELRTALSQQNSLAGKKEDSLRDEIVHLRTTLDAAEKRNEEIMQSIPDSTRPLLRQIEALQALLENKSRSADTLERDLRARLADEEARCFAAQENYRVSTASLSSMTHRVTQLETQYEEEHTLVSKLRMEVETLKLEEKKYKRMALELGAKLTAVELHEDRLNTELRQAEEKHQRTISAMKELEEAFTKSRDKEKEAREELNKLHRFGPSTNGPYNMQRSNSTSQDLSASTQSVGLPNGGGSLNSSIGSPMLSSTSSSSGNLHTHSGPIVERLQAMLNHRDGEIAVLQSQLSSMEAARKELQEELAAVTSRNETLTQTDTDLQATQAALQDLQTKFATALQLVGEKEEQVMELRLDIQDLKEMYRTQISELIEQNECLSRKK